MIVALVIAIFALGCVPVWLYHKLATATIDSLREETARLYSDNQSLMQALAQAGGQHLEFKPPEKSQPIRRSPIPAPYWQPKQEREIQIGEKKVTVHS